MALFLSTIITLEIFTLPSLVWAEETSSGPDSKTTTTESPASGSTTDLGIQSPGAILMEAHTGTILYEQGSHTQLRPASVTKIMTILLAYEAVRDGRATLDDMVTVSKNAAGYGGSTILLEEGEQISLRNLIKGMC
ncbi:MAG: D-alanyl-D-alanine carboxypeptidase, partial [Firmicutes bacterium]|nr:D-alanyl-D-alanine carboxypeptidase [Bacillota bacterium]